MLNNVAGSYNPFIPSPDYADPNQFEEEFDAQEDDHEAESAVDDRKGFIGRRGSQKAEKKRAEHPMKEAAQHKANGLGLFDPKTFLAQANQALLDLQLVESAEKTDLEKNPEFTDIPIMRAPVSGAESSYGGLYELLGEVANILGDADILKLKENLKLLKENRKALENNSKEIESLVTNREELEEELKKLSKITDKEEKEKKLQQISLKIKDLNEKTNTLLKNHDLTHDQMKRMQDNVLSLTQLMAEVINLMSESSSIDIQNTKKVMEAEFQNNITQMKEQIKKNKEAMEKANEMKKNMGCIAKVIGHVVTAITVLSSIAAVFTGGASLVIAALALGLLIADKSLELSGKKSLTARAMEPLMKAIADGIASRLEKDGLDKDKANLIAAILTAIILAVVLVLVSAGLALKSVSQLISKIVPKFISKFIGKMSSKTTQLMLKYGNYIMQTLRAILHPTGHAINGTGEIISNDYKGKSVDAQAEIKRLQFERKRINELRQSIESPMESISDAVVHLKEDLSQAILRALSSMQVFVRAIKG